MYASEALLHRYSCRQAQAQARRVWHCIYTSVDIGYHAPNLWCVWPFRRLKRLRDSVRPTNCSSMLKVIGEVLDCNTAVVWINHYLRT